MSLSICPCSRLFARLCKYRRIFGCVNIRELMQIYKDTRTWIFFCPLYICIRSRIFTQPNILQYMHKYMSHCILAQRSSYPCIITHLCPCVFTITRRVHVYIHDVLRNSGIFTRINGLCHPCHHTSNCIFAWQDVLPYLRGSILCIRTRFYIFTQLNFREYLHEGMTILNSQSSMSKVANISIFSRINLVDLHEWLSLAGMRAASGW